MPLTVEQQKRLNELKARRSELLDVNAPSGRTPEQEQRLQQLKQQRADLITRQASQDQKVNQLIGQLRGKLPSDRPLPPSTPFIPGASGPSDVVRRQEIQRRQSFQELSEMGFEPEQIKLSLQAQNILGGARVGRGVGGFGGAIGATALAGRIIPGPVDDAAIMMGLIASIGAGTGGVAGEAAQTAIQEKRLIGKREALKAFAIEAGTEAGGRIIMSPFIKATVPEAAALVDDFAKVGGQFSPSELDRRFHIRIGEAFSRGSFGAKEIFQEFEEKQGQAALTFANNILESISEGVARQTAEEIGETFASGISRPGGRVFKILDDLFDPLFKQVDEIAQSGSQVSFRQIKKGGPTVVRGAKGQFQVARELQKLQLKPTVSTDSLKAFAKKQLATDKRLNGQFLSGVGRSKLEGVIGLNDKLSFSDMRTLRSSFLKDARKMARDVDQSQGIIKQLAGITDSAIFDPKAAQGLNPEALNLLRNTNSLYKQAQKGLETTFSERLAKRLLNNPSRVTKELFPNNNPKSIRLLRKSLIEPIGGKPSAEGKVLWNQLRQSWLADAVDEATKEGVVNPRTYNNILRKMGRPAFEEMFPEKAARDSVDKIQTLFALAGKTPPSGASLFSRGAQTLGVVKLWQGAKAGDMMGITKGGILSIGPLAFAKLATTPKGIKFLTTGFKARVGSPAIVPNVVRMVRLLREITNKENRQKIAKERSRTRKQRIRQFAQEQVGRGL